MNAPIIIDSSAFISLGTISDNNHKKATIISDRIKEENRRVIMPGEIFTEVVNVAGKKINHQAALDQAHIILSSKAMHIEETTLKIRQNALSKFEQQPKSVSFTDCLVMAFADEFVTREIFGFDETFHKNGYILFGIDKEERL